MLPCYNPVEGWEQVVQHSLRALEAAIPGMEIFPILVNDGSSKGIIPAHISFLQREFPHMLYLENEENKGKGFSLREGIKHSQNKLCVYTDIDFPYTLESITGLIYLLRNEPIDIAVGIKDESYYSHLPKGRTVISKGLRWMARTFLNISITDTQCGLKGFNPKGRDIFLKTQIERYLCDLEFIFLADNDSDVQMQAFAISLKPGVEFSSVDPKILLREGRNFLQIWLRSRFRGNAKT